MSATEPGLVTAPPDGVNDDTPVPTDPWDLVAAWLPGNEDPLRPPMTLATVDAEGWPNARTVLLSSFSAAGLCFHADARSRKIAEVDATGRATVVLHLPERARQLVVRGAVEAVPAEEAATAYHQRSAYLQVLAWLNALDFAALPLSERIAQWSAFAAAHPVPAPPPTWVGRRIVPERMTFWAGREDTASRRVEYAATPAGWQVSVLAG